MAFNRIYRKVTNVVLSVLMLIGLFTVSAKSGTSEYEVKAEESTQGTIIYDANGGYFGSDPAETTNAVTYDFVPDGVGTFEVKKYSHTENVSDTGVQLYDHKDDWGNANISGTDRGSVSQAHIISIPGANNLTVDLYFSSQETRTGRVSIWKGSHPEYSAQSSYDNADKVTTSMGAPNNNNQYGGISMNGVIFDYYNVNGNTLPLVGKVTFTIPGDTVTFSFFSSYNKYYYHRYGYYAIVHATTELNKYKKSIINGTEYIPNSGKKGYVFDCWCLDPDCAYPFDQSCCPEEETLRLYAKYKDASKTLIDGKTFNKNIKILSGQSSATYSTSNTSITSIERSLELPKDGTITTDISADQDGSIIAWFDNGTIYWYSEADTVYMNEDSSYMFYSCSGLTSLDVSGFDTSKVTNMVNMFNKCSGLTSLDVSSFDTSNVTNMGSMFYNCSSLTSLDVTNFNTSKVTNMNTMFYSCSNLTELDLSSFDTSNVTTMNSMFYGCNSLTELDVSNFNTSNVTNMKRMFCYCTALPVLELSSFDTSKVTDMTEMFRYCGGLKTIYVSNLWNTTKVSSSTAMFASCNNLTGENGTTFESAKVTNKEYARVDNPDDAPGYLSDISHFPKARSSELNITNEPYHNFTLKKISSEDSSPLQGAVFRLSGESDYGTYVDKKVSSSNAGLVEFNRLEPGTYLLSEEEAPTGYLMDFQNHIVTVNKDGTVNISGLSQTGSVFPVVNEKQKENEIIIIKKWKDGLVGADAEGRAKPRIWINTDWRIFLTTGQDFSKIIKDLSNEVSVYGRNTRIKKFERSTTAPAEGKTVADISKNKNGSVVAWFDNGTIYWYSEADTVYMNEDSSSMFDYCESLSSIDLSGFDTSNVINFEKMFNKCASVPSLDLSNFDTSKAENMSNMFAACKQLSSVDLSNFDTSRVTDMSGLFKDCTNISSLNLDPIDSSNVVNMSEMFRGCNKLTSLDLSPLETSNVTDMSGMFYDCSKLTSLDLSPLDTSSVTNMSSMFRNCSGLPSLNLSPLDTSSVTDMSYMFYGCRGLPSLNLSPLDTSSVTDMSYMFGSCEELTSLDLSPLDTSNVTNMNHMFYYCSKLTPLDLSPLETSNVTDMSGMFGGCRKLTSLDLSPLDTAKVTNMSYMFAGCSGLTSLDLSPLDTSSVTDMSYMFESCTGLTSLDLSPLDTSNVTNMSGMFFLCTGLTSLDLSPLDTSKVTDMSYMFTYADHLTSIDPRNFDTSNVTNMSYMFAECFSAVTIDLSSFDTSKVTDMSNMFNMHENQNKANKLKQIYVGPGWTTDNVSNSGSMFLDDTLLVGGAGTAFNSSHIDKEYAHVDEGTDNPGYLTMATRFLVVSHTSNVDDSGKKISNYKGNWTNANITGTDRGDTSQAHVITIPGAESLTVDIYYNGEKYDWACVWEGAHPEYTAASNYSDSVSGKLGGSQSGTYTVNGNKLTKMGKKTLTIQGNTVTFGFKSNGSNVGQGYGYYAVVKKAS